MILRRDLRAEQHFLNIEMWELPMKRVLLVDDNQDARHALRIVLESQGLECAGSLQWISCS